MLHVGVPEVEPAGPVINEKLVVLKIQTRNQRDLSFDILSDLMVTLTFLESSQENSLLINILLINQNSILSEDVH